jgi:hypothetical protein
LHSTVAVASSIVKAKCAVVSLVSASGASSIVVAGASVSIVHV